ncbi:unnamed protein product, partial [Gongylonema pulchrum]|uniref:WH2 domain-containing protein n=1 Tax=Gongylonema pulchrum TaxID=637853 RepID=A0A183EU67_9BILA
MGFDGSLRPKPPRPYAPPPPPVGVIGAAGVIPANGAQAFP